MAEEAEEEGRGFQQLKIRVKRALYQRLWGKATMEAMSLNAVVIDLIERGFQADRPLEQVFGSAAAFQVARACMSAAEVSAARHGCDRGRWLWDVDAFDDVAIAIQQTLATLRPSPPEVERVRQELAVERERQNWSSE